MKRISTVLVVSAALLIGCSDDSKVASSDPNDTNAAAGAMPEPANTAPAADSGAAQKPWESSSAQAGQTTPQSKPASTQAKYPKGEPITGRKGFVKSPYAPHAAPVDVQGFPSGSQVYCPHTHKIFIVP